MPHLTPTVIDVSMTFAKLDPAFAAAEAASSRSAQEVDKNALERIEERAPRQTIRDAAFVASIS